MSTIEQIKSRAEEIATMSTADLARKIIKYREEYRLLAKFESDHRKLINAVEAVERRCKDLDQLAAGDKHYAKIFREAIASALGEES